MSEKAHGSPRFALVIDRFDGRRGGAERWTRGFAEWLANKGCDVHVLARSIGPGEAHLPITFHAIDRHSPLEFAEAVSKRLAAIRPLLSHDMGAAIGCDVFQPHVGSSFGCWEGSVASCAAWYRPVKRLCGLAPRYRRIRRMTRAQFDGGSRIFIALSQKVARDMQALHHVPAEQIRIVYNGIDLSHFVPAEHSSQRLAVRQRYGIGGDEVLVVAVAHHFRLKGIPLLIRTVCQLRSEGVAVKLLVCGGKNSVNSGSDQHGAILHCGKVEDVAPFYAAADICVHPTFYDACSLVTLEALACGLPVVTTRANGASELITPGVNGLLLDEQHDLPTLAAVLRLLVRDAELRRALGAAGRRLAMAHSAEQNYREIAATYTDVLAEKSMGDGEFEPLQEEWASKTHVFA